MILENIKRFLKDIEFVFSFNGIGKKWHTHVLSDYADSITKDSSNIIQSEKEIKKVTNNIIGEELPRL